MKVVVAMLGARMHYAVPRIVHGVGMLERFYTDTYIGNKPWLGSLIRAIPSRGRPRALERLLGRQDKCLPRDKVRSFDLLGARYAWARRKARSTEELNDTFAAMGRAFNHRILAEIPKDVDIIWGYNSACLELFEWAKKRGIRCIVEQTIAPRRIQEQLMREERARWPGWEPGLQASHGRDPLAAREEAEWALADRIVAGSGFVGEGLRACGVAGDKVRVIPYGVDPERFRGGRPPRRRTGPLRVLFAGEVGLRKGVPDLLHALGRIKRGKVEARLAGAIRIAPEKLAPFRNIAQCLGPVPRPGMPGLYRWADVFVLPSIVEGSATVTYEALSSGLPVITTPNAGSVVRNEVDGFVVPIREPGMLAERIESLADDRMLLVRMCAAALERAREYTVERYGERVIGLLGEVT